MSRPGTIPVPRSPRMRAWVWAGIVVVALLAAFALTRDHADTRAAGRDAATGLPWITPGALPPEARDTLARIDAGGPLRYAKDGAVFGNREGLLPRRARGFYREYTVPTPGEGDRGARRIVTGAGEGWWFYTGDHYASFSRIRR